MWNGRGRGDREHGEERVEEGVYTLWVLGFGVRRVMWCFMPNVTVQRRSHRNTRPKRIRKRGLFWCDEDQPFSESPRSGLAILVVHLLCGHVPARMPGCSTEN